MAYLSSTAETQPNRADDPLAHFQPIVIEPPRPSRSVYHLIPPQRRPWGCCLAAALFLVLGCILLTWPYLAWPERTNVLVLGVDTRQAGSNLGRTDTMILATFQPLRPYVGMLTIPRDLWVTLPNGEQNRINTAHFFAEAEQEGSGPAAAMQAVRQNFGVDVHYYIRLRFDGIRNIVDALGGLDVTLPRAMSGYPAGTHHLDGAQALALVRDRSGSDDLYRNERALIFLRSLFHQAMRPASWGRFPVVYVAVARSVDSDIPPWQWPRLALALLRVGADGLDGHTITHEMVTPYTTQGGAAVLLPNWELINPLLFEVFGQ